LRLSRPKQWIKNLLVAAAPFAAGVMDDWSVLLTVLAGIVAFSIVSSGIYAINDARDYRYDQVHPTKRFRPVASGAVSPRAATLFGSLLIVAGITLGLLAGNSDFAMILLVYVGTSIAYSLWLKQIALIDIAIIAFGFLLRAISGAVLVDVPISEWFLIVTMFGALFIAAGKRFAERLEVEGNGESHRAALADYAPGFIEFLLATSAAVVLLSYSLWALEIQDGVKGIPWAAISLGPFVLAVLRYAQLIYLGRGAEPETLIVSDRGLQVIGVVWAIAIAAAFYGGTS
jgi:decaprenyl-phosphate phosphoribosyltransferase